MSDTPSSTSLSARDWNPLDPAFRRDPFPWYQALREQAPALEHPDVGVVLSRYEDIDRVLRDKRFGVATPNPWREMFASVAPASMRLISENALLFIDAPQHGRVRSLVAKAFSPRRVEALRPRLETMVDEMLDKIEGATSFDLMDTVAGPFPIMAISELLGVSEDDHQRLHDWTVAITAFDELPIDFRVLESAGVAADEFIAWASDLVTLRRAAPGDDLVSGLIAAEEEGEHLTQDELLAMIVLLLVAGHDTTMSLISTGLFLLLQHPEAADEVRHDAAIVPAAIEEILRYLGPLQVASGGGRWPAEPVEIAGTVIEPGTSVRLLLGSANRDPEVFADADTFDIHRTDLNHLAFGKGVHFCIGAALGRLEGQVVIPAVLQRFPGLSLVQAKPVWRETFVTRQLATLPVHVA
jgi:cytochrome P450